MNDFFPLITDSLRRELSEYGGLLNLFEEQQRALFNREADRVLLLSGAIEQQVSAMQDCRRQREQLVTEFALAHGASPKSTLRSLLPLFAEAVRPLVEALVREVNVLIHRIRRASQHNQLLLASAVESHQQALRLLRPEAFTPTYSANGRARLAGGVPSAALRTAG